MLQLAVFDIAGTTVKDEDFVSRSVHNAFERKGIQLDNVALGPLMGYHKPLAVRMILEQVRIAPDESLINEIHDDFVREMLAFYENSPEVQPLPGAEEIFRYLKQRGVPIALNTGFSRNIAAVIVERFDWVKRGLIDAYIGSDEVENGRPHPDMINELRRRLDVPGDAVIMKVGDTIVDVQEGKAAGCKFNVAVTTGASTIAELEKQQPTHIINFLLEIPAILQASLQAYA